MSYSTPPHVSPRDFVKHKFDYLVVGGGTAGLVVAARLSENPDITVGILEAGPFVSEESITIPGLYGCALGTHYDWNFVTTAQPGLGGRKLPWPRGKVLGGTSAINFMTWNRATGCDYDAWEKLGNRGWGWDALLPYFKRSETFHQPSDLNQQENRLYYDPTAFGNSGPIKVAYSREFSASHQYWHKTLNTLGVETNKRHMSGSNVGVWTNLAAVDPDMQTRSYAANAYYLPAAARPNLVLLLGALVKEVLVEQDGKGDWAAKGVTFEHDGAEYSALVSQEVVISAGTVQSPQILELSGIGNTEVLNRASITVKVNSPNVGENLQEHIMATTIFEVDPSLPNPDDLKHQAEVAQRAMKQYTETKTGPLTILANSFCYLPLDRIMGETSHRRILDKVRQLRGIPTVKSQILESRFNTLDASRTPTGQIEYIFDLGNWSPFFKPDPAEGKKYATCLQIHQHPFVRGSIHVSASENGQKGTMHNDPVIDPKYYMGQRGELDLGIMVEAAKFATKISQTKPMSSIIRGRAFPPPSVDNNPDDLKQWLTDTTITDWHPVGTCAMGGTAGIKGGVVDDRLRVYGVKGLRVVDASVMPLQIGGHLQATIYAIAEKGAEMMAEDRMALRAGTSEKQAKL